MKPEAVNIIIIAAIWIAILATIGIVGKLCKTAESKDRWQAIVQIAIGIFILVVLAKGCDGGFHPYIPPDP